MEFVWIFYSISWGQKSLYTFFFVDLAPDFPLCLECQERNRRSSICILRTRSREMMKKSNNFKSGCSGNHHLCQVFGGFQCECEM